ncbi:rhodanese-like domain-containing protein [Marinicrinis sediminis]|uniref:Rhodanese-like domain-containing protein n=1 Tax=Marinicrinis sediminis TaxID=1652465 RepID=A0ABW5RFT5_9BACL
MDIVFYALTIGLIGWMIYRQFAPVKGLRTMQAEDFKKASKGHKLIDVREPHEFKEGHLPGAVNLPLSQFRSRLSEIPRDREVYLYCRSGMRSKQASKWLVRSGHRNVAHLSGGLLSWQGGLKR